MTIDDLIDRAKKDRARALSRAAELRDDCARLKAAAAKERRALADDDAYASAKRALDAAGTEVEELSAAVDRYEAEKARDEVVNRLQDEVHPGAPAPSYGGTTTRGRDVYTEERDKTGERSYFSDMFRSQVLNDVGASQRIAQHNAERAAASTAFAGLVPPQYLIDQAALVARAGRPFANSVLSLQLPDQGTSLIVPRGTTGASVASQATENTAVSSTDEVWQNVNVPVVTVAGQATPSRQSLERGAPGIDSLIYADLAGAYAAELDRQLLAGSGGSNQVLGVINTAGVAQSSAFTAAATISTFYTKTAGQIASISTARGLPPDSIAMHPRRYAWLLAQTDSAGRPLVTPDLDAGAQNAMGGTGGAPGYGTGAGKFLGLAIVVDSNMPASVGSGPEDQVVVYRASDLLLWENADGMPTELRFEQTLGNQLTVTLVSYGYAGFTAGRYPSAAGIIGGNAAAGFGLVAPTF